MPSATADSKFKGDRSSSGVYSKMIGTCMCSMDVKEMCAHTPAIISAPGLLPLPTLISFRGTGRTALVNGLSPFAAEACRSALWSCFAAVQRNAGLHSRRFLP